MTFLKQMFKNVCDVKNNFLVNDFKHEVTLCIWNISWPICLLLASYAEGFRVPFSMLESMRHGICVSAEFHMLT
jgi:hypothetical protein